MLLVDHDCDSEDGESDTNRDNKNDKDYKKS